MTRTKVSKGSPDRVTVRIDEAVEVKLLAIEALLKCSRSEAIRHCILRSDDSIKGIYSAIGDIKSPIESLIAEFAKLKRASEESIRIPSFLEFRARAVAEGWEEARNRVFSNEDLILLGKKYAMMYGILPSTDDMRSFGNMPDNFDPLLFRRHVSALVNAQIRRDHGGVR